MVFTSIVLFFVGTMLGSFLSVVIHRIHTEKKGIFFGRSECPSCSKQLCFGDLVPIFSYLFSLGKCKHCKKPIGITYLLLEIFCGLILTALYLKFQFNTTTNILYYCYYAVISILSIGIFFYDIKYQQIPEIFTYPGIVLIFIVSIFLPGPGFFEMAIGGALGALFFGFQVIISKEQWMGAGDTQVGILIGMFLGWKYLIMALLIAYLIGSILSLVLLAAGKVKGNTKIAFAPFLITALFIVIFFGDYMYNLYISTLL